MGNTDKSYMDNFRSIGLNGVQIGNLSYLQKKHKSLIFAVRPRNKTYLRHQDIKRVKRESIFKVNKVGYKEDFVYLLESTMEITGWFLKGKPYLRYLSVILAVMVSLNLLSPALYSMHIPFLPLPESVVKGNQK